MRAYITKSHKGRGTNSRNSMAGSSMMDYWLSGGAGSGSRKALQAMLINLGFLWKEKKKGNS